MDFAAARHSMVENQLRTNKITDRRLIEVMQRLPREEFVPAHLRGVAYVDEDVALGGGRFLMEPLVLAQLLQTAAIAPADTVLEVGSASGYGAAVISQLARSVVGLESDPELATTAKRTLESLEMGGVETPIGPLTEGYPQRAPYDVIVFGGAVAEIPAAIIDQLGEGGRMVAVVTGADGASRGMEITRFHGTVTRRAAFEGATPLLPGFERQPGFVF